MGGSAQEWTGDLGSGLVGGAPIELRLVMTNFNSEVATLGYEVVVKAL